jgi:hypothetical protein
MSTANQRATFEAIEQAAQAQSKYMKIQPGQTVVLKFDPTSYS